MSKLAITAGMGMALAFANLASANVVISVSPASVVQQLTGPFMNDYLYDYAVQLDGKQEFISGGPVDGYCVANIPGFLGVPTFSVAGFTETTGTTGGCNSAPQSINAGVDTSNTGPWIEILYTGTATIAPSTSLPDIMFYSTYNVGTVANLPVGGRAEDNGTGGHAAGTATANQSDIVGPANAPEPATLTLFGSALLGIGFFARKRIKKN